MLTVSRFAQLVSVASVAVLAASVVPAVGDAQSPPAKGPDLSADQKKEEIDLRKQVKANPNDPAAHLKLGRFYYRTNRYLEAEVEATEAKRTGASPSDTDPLLAWVLLMQGKTDDLLSKIKPGDREPVAESRVRLTLGQAYFNMKSYKTAEPLLRDSARLEPTAPMPHLALADVFLASGNLAGAREEVKAAQQIAPDRGVVVLYTGRMFRADGKPDQAVDAYSKILEGDPGNVGALDDRTSAFLAQDKVADAQRDNDTAMKSSSRDAQTLYLSALLMARQGKMKEADARLSPMANSFNRRPERYYLAGVVSYAVGKTEQADADLAKFLTYDHDAAGALRLRSEMALKRKDATGVIEALKPVVAANSADFEATIVLARAYVSNGSIDAALDLYKRAVEPPPKGKAPAPAPLPETVVLEFQNVAAIDRITASAIGESAEAPAIWDDLRRGDPEKAAAIAEASAKAASDDPGAQELLGAVRIAQRRYPEAETIFRDLLKNKPGSVGASLNLAEILVAEKKVDDAKLVLQNLAARGL